MGNETGSDVVTFSNLPPRNRWSRKHLNWALVLYSMAVTVVTVPIMLVSALGDNFESSQSVVLYVLFVAVNIIFQWYMCIWNLKHKGRSMQNLLYLLIPYIGGIAFLCVGNRVEMERDEEWERKDREERERYRKELEKN